LNPNARQASLQTKHQSFRTVVDCDPQHGLGWNGRRAERAPEWQCARNSLANVNAADVLKRRLLHLHGSPIRGTCCIHCRFHAGDRASRQHHKSTRFRRFLCGIKGGCRNETCRNIGNWRSVGIKSGGRSQVFSF
jgi:hypothetical protein